MRSNNKNNSNSRFTSANFQQHRFKKPQGNGGIPLYLWIGMGLPMAGGVVLYYRYLDTVPLTQRKRWIATSPEWERQLGDQEYQQLMKQFRNNILPSDHRATITTKRVGQRIFKAAQEFSREYHLSQDLPLMTTTPTFTVIRSEMANAFVLPNNHIFVFTGLFQFARDEDDLAAVLGHEMAHNLARHVGEKVSGNLIVQILARLSLLLDPSGVLLTIFLPTASLLRELPHSRIQELEADRIGMNLAAKACYDPAAAGRVFGRMKQQEHRHAQPPEFLSTHPSNESRIEKMEEWLPDTRSILERNEGESCRRIREEMAYARLMAAQQAAQRENASQSFTATSRSSRFSD